MLRQKVLEGAAGWPEAEEAQPGALPLSEPLGVRTGAEDLELLANSFAGDIFHFLQEKTNWKRSYRCARLPHRVLPSPFPGITTASLAS